MLLLSALDRVLVVVKLCCINSNVDYILKHQTSHAAPTPQAPNAMGSGGSQEINDEERLSFLSKVMHPDQR